MVTHLHVISANELDYLLGLVMLNVNNNSRTTCSYILRLFISFIILPYNTRQTISTVYTHKKKKKTLQFASTNYRLCSQ